MKADVPELLFVTRGDFRIWLCENATTSDGIWLVFGKTKAVVTLTANDALEEALCFGWIDGQMKELGVGTQEQVTGGGGTTSKYEGSMTLS